MACSFKNTVLYNLPPMSETEEQLLDTLEAVTKQIAVAVTRCSRDFRYIWANQAYADWIQRPLNEIVERPILEVLGRNAFEALLPYFNRVLAGETVRYEQETNFQGIGLRWTSATYSPTPDANGATNGWVAVVVDVTERRRAEQALRESEERLRLAVQAARMFAFSWDPATDVIERSGESGSQRSRQQITGPDLTSCPSVQYALGSQVENRACHPGSDSRSTKSVLVGIARFKRKPARPRRSRYSSTVRSSPPVRTSIYRSTALPSEGWLGSERLISRRRRAPFPGTTLRQFRRICRASSSFQSWITLFIR